MFQQFSEVGKRLLGRPRRKCEDNIRMYFKELTINTRNWDDSAQGRDYWRTLEIEELNVRVS